MAVTFNVQASTPPALSISSSSLSFTAVQVSGAQSTLNRAANLAETYVEYGDASLVNTEYQKFGAVTKEDIMRVAKKYLVESNRSVVITLPAAKPAKQ